MKNSNTYLLVALLVLLASLTAYNMGLRNEFRKGSYKDPLRDFTTLNFKNFSEIDLQAAGLLNAKIVAGPFGVRLNPEATKWLQIRQQGQRLVVKVDFPEGVKTLGWGQNIVISCPRLTRLNADAVYQLRGQPQVNRANPWGKILVQGFRQDSLTVRTDHATLVELADNYLAHLQAMAGASPGSRSQLELSATNHLAAADLAMQHQSELVVSNLAISALHWQFGDSAKATLTGAALGSLPK